MGRPHDGQKAAPGGTGLAQRGQDILIPYDASRRVKGAIGANQSPFGNVAYNVARAIFLFPTVFLAAAAFGQRTMTVHTPPGDVVAFATKGLPTATPADPVDTRDTDVATISLDGGKDTACVWDRENNRVACAPAKGADWAPALDSLKDVAQVTVAVRRDGKPVAAANVTLDDGRRTQTILVDPGAKGDATFFYVRAGSIKATVRYRAAGKDAAPVTQIFDSATGSGKEPVFTVALPEAAETLGDPTTAAAPSTKGVPGAEAAKALENAGGSGGGGGFNFVGTLFAILVGGGVAAGAWYLLKKNPDAAGATLERLGAQIPKPGDAPLADPPVAPAPAAAPPAPPQKIVLDAMPDPIQMPVPVAVSVSEPSLVSEAGIPIPLMEGETVVGREVGLGLSLAGESTVSRRHATVTRRGGTVTVQDEGSTNGTFVNGVPASGSTTLRPGDSVQFGSVRFRYEG